MKKFIAGFVILFVFAVTVPITADAQTCRGNRNYRSNRYNSRNNSNRNYQTRGYVYQRPNFYQRNRNLINVGIGTGAGALIGGILGGKKGAFIGGALGAGGSALYTYKIRPQRKRYNR